jgi:YVTN family beta-propeller protein
MKFLSAVAAAFLMLTPAAAFAGPSIAGNFQGWDPADPAHELSLNANGVYVLTISAGDSAHYYKGVDGDAWGQDFPWRDQSFNPSGPQDVTFHCNLGDTPGTREGDEYVFHSLNPPIVCGDFMSELGGVDWDETDTSTTLMHDDDGDDIWEFSAVVPSGDYEFKIVLNNNWDQDTYPPSANYSFASNGAEPVLFRYHMADNTTEVLDLPRTLWHVDIANFGYEDGSASYPYNTIQEGVDAASNGDTVLVHPGVYAESDTFLFFHIPTVANVFVDKNISLLSSDGPWVTVIEGLGSVETGVVCLPDTVGTSPSERPLVSGFSIENQTFSGVCAVYCDVMDNYISNQSIGVSTYADYGGVSHGSSSTTWEDYYPPFIAGNVISAVDKGISLGHGPDSRTVALVDGNIIDGGEHGVHSYQPDWGSATRRLELVRNTITGCTKGVYVSDSSHGPDTELILHRNEIRDNEGHNIWLYSQGGWTTWDAEIGGSLANANDIYSAPTNAYCSANIQGMINLSHNYWGTVECDSVLALISGQYDSLYPFTSSAHADLYLESDCDAPRVWHVDAGYTGYEDGTEERPFDTILEGVGISSNGDTVLVHPGVYAQSDTFVVGAPVVANVFIDKNIALLSTDGPGVTTIDGRGSVETGVVCIPDTAGTAPADRPMVAGFSIENQTYAGVCAVYSDVLDNVISNQSVGVSTYAYYSASSHGGQESTWSGYAPAHVSGNVISAIDHGVHLGHGPDSRTAATLEGNEISGSEVGIYSTQPDWGTDTRRIELIGNVVSGCTEGVSITDSSQSPDTELVLHGNELHHNYEHNVHLNSPAGMTTWDLQVGGSLANANDIYAGGLNVSCHVQGTRDFSCNYWGTVDCSEIMLSLSGDVDVFPFTSSDHSEVHSREECGPVMRGYFGCSTDDSFVSIDLFSLATNNAGTLLPEGDYPYDATMRPSGQEVWMPGASGDGVVVVNTSSDTASHRIAGIGSYPVSVAFTVDDSRALVSCRDSENIALVSTADYAVVSTLPVGASAGNLAVDPTSGRFYMVEWYGDSLYEIAPDGTSILRSTTIGGSLWQLVADPGGTYIYVTDRQNDRVNVVDRATLTVHTTVSVGDDPWGIDVTEDGTRLVVACEDDASVWIIDTSDWSASAEYVPEPGLRPRDVDIRDATGEAFVAADDYFVVLEVEPDDPGYSPSYYLGVCGNHNVVAVQPQASDVGTAVDGDSAEQTVPGLSCYPNPLTSETTIRYSVPVSGEVNVSIYDVRGRLVATLEDGQRVAGAHEIVWRGVSDSGREVASGVYFVRASVGRETHTGKLLFVR